MQCRALMRNIWNFGKDVFFFSQLKNLPTIVLLSFLPARHLSCFFYFQQLSCFFCSLMTVFSGGHICQSRAIRCIVRHCILRDFHSFRIRLELKNRREEKIRICCIFLTLFGLRKIKYSHLR